MVTLRNLMDKGVKISDPFADFVAYHSKEQDFGTFYQGLKDLCEVLERNSGDLMLLDYSGFTDKNKRIAFPGPSKPRRVERKTILARLEKPEIRVGEYNSRKLIIPCSNYNTFNEAKGWQEQEGEIEITEFALAKEIGNIKHQEFFVSMTSSNKKVRDHNNNPIRKKQIRIPISKQTKGIEYDFQPCEQLILGNKEGIREHIQNNLFQRMPAEVPNL